jgi:hypothetical protein
LSISDLRDMNLVFSKGRDHGYAGRIFNQAVLIRDSLEVSPDGTEISAFASRRRRQQFDDLHRHRALVSGSENLQKALAAVLQIPGTVPRHLQLIGDDDPGRSRAKARRPFCLV